MAIDVDGAPAAPLAASPEAVRYRPGTEIARWVRGLCGVREDILDFVPEERPHYTGLGVIVLNTGCLAALAMFTAVTKIVTAPALALVPIALFWGWIILSIDRWLIASTHGMHEARRLPLVFLPRLLLAILLALSIAEPLTLRVFQPALDREVRSDQSAQLMTYESKLQSCNPDTGVPVGSAQCNGYGLSIKDPPNGVQNQLAEDQAQAAQLQSQVSGIEAQLSALRMTAQNECAGHSGPGLTGLAGVGWRCTKDWGAVTSYQNASGLADKQNLLRSLGQQISVLNGKAGSAQQQAATEVNAAITAAVNAKKQTQRGQIGLLDEWSALEQLSARSSFVNVGHWLLLLLLIALDTLPIAAKLMSRNKTYDVMFSRQVESAERIHDVDLQLREQKATSAKEIEFQLGEMAKQDDLRRMDRDERIGRAQREADVVASAEELAQRWIREAEQRDAEWGPADGQGAGSAR